MRRLKITLTLLFVFAFFQPSTLQACDLSRLCLDSVVNNGSSYTIHLTLCLGAGTTGGVHGAIGNTGNFLLTFASNTPGFYVSSFPTSIVSQVTNVTANGVNVGSQPAFNAAQALLYGTSGGSFTCISNTPICGNIHQECYPLVITVTALPDSIKAYGIEGDGFLNGGCNNSPELMVSFNPNSDNCCVLNGSVSTTNATLCTGGNGTAAFVPSGGIGPFSFLWSNGDTATSLSNLAAGNYSVLVTDSVGCSRSFPFAISNVQNLPTVTLSNNTAATCNQPNGSLAITASGGNGGPYSYAWSNGSTTASISNLTPGNYSVTVTDAGNCSVANTYTVVNTPGPSVSVVNQSPDNCGQNSGSITVVGTGGFGAPYSYLWSNGGATANQSGLSSGTYTVTVTDNAGCTTVGSYSISAYGGPSATFTLQQPNCTIGTMGSITLAGSTGTPPLSYLWSNGATTGSIANLSQGIYSVTVTDGVGCTFMVSNLQIVGGVAPTGTVSIIAEDYCGLGNGSLEVTAIGGTAPYSYQWSNGVSGMSQSNLPAGIYTVTVTDSLGCFTTISSTIAAIAGQTLATTSTPASGATVADGSANTVASGGNSPYTYAWSNGGNTASISGLLPGTYTVTVTDAQGCVAVDTIVVSFTVGVNLAFDNGLQLYPNPTQNRFNLERIHATEPATVHLFDLMGKCLGTREWQSGETLLVWEAQMLAKGVYLLQVRQGHAVWNIRLVKE